MKEEKRWRRLMVILVIIAIISVVIPLIIYIIAKDTTVRIIMAGILAMIIANILAIRCGAGKIYYGWENVISYILTVLLFAAIILWFLVIPLAS